MRWDEPKARRSAVTDSLLESFSSGDLRNSIFFFFLPKTYWHPPLFGGCLPGLNYIVLKMECNAILLQCSSTMRTTNEKNHLIKKLPLKQQHQTSSPLDNSCTPPKSQSSGPQTVPAISIRGAILDIKKPFAYIVLFGLWQYSLLHQIFNLIHL